jgi:hypothetical protein
VDWLAGSLSELPGLRPFRNQAEGQPGYYKLGLQYDARAWADLSREQIAAALRAEGVALSAGFRTLHVGRSAGRFRKFGELGEAERAHAGALVLHHPVLLGDQLELEEVIRAFRKVFTHSGTLAGSFAQGLHP